MSEHSVYRDSFERYAHDAEFHAAVESLVQFGERSGYTPGELKQVAFMAACLIETRHGRPKSYEWSRFTHGQSLNEIRERCGLPPLNEE